MTNGNRWILLLSLFVLIALLHDCQRDEAGGEGPQRSENQFGDETDLDSKGTDFPERDIPVQVISQDEFKRMERYVEEHAIRTGVVDTLVMPEGDIVDCVEITKQPALLRPEMNSHQIMTRPAFEPVEMKSAAPTDARPAGVSVTQSYGTATRVCPDSSVPMRRLTLETLIRFKTLEDFLRKLPADIGRISDPPVSMQAVKGIKVDLPTEGSMDRHQYAAARQYVDNWGAESVLNLWRPYTELSKEFTLSQIWVARGSGDSTETVEAGWQKYKQKYRDWNSRLFIYFTPDNYGNGGCYNVGGSCDKFVQTNNSVYIEGAFNNYSSKDGNQYIVKLLWYKDGPGGHWWLRYFDTWVGYYPRELFDDAGLRDHGSRVTFGGEMTDYQTESRHSRTDMGSGRWPYEDFRWAAYQRSVRYVDTENFYRYASDLNPIVTDAKCYDLEKGSSSGSWEEYFFFGGSGYNTECE